MKPFTYGGYVYLNDIDEIPKHYHQLFIHKKGPGMTITSPKTLLKKKLIKYPTNVVDSMLVPWI